jgi:ornithine carbamoyltransferase
MTRSFLSFSDITHEELNAIFARMKEIKSKTEGREKIGTLEGLVVGLLFEKPSTRTSAGFQVATLRLGGHSLYFSSNELQLSRGEPIKDTARVLGADVDALVARVFSHDTLVQLAQYSNVPVVNALSDLEHPTQIVSDLFTILEVKGRLRDLRLAYIGDGNNVCNSLILGAATTGMQMVAACPKGYEPNQEILKRAQNVAKATGSVLKIVQSPAEAAKDSDVLYTDVWVSMGEEDEAQKRMRDFEGYQINSSLLKSAKEDAVVMHCLPAHRGLEITDDVLEGKRSVAWQQAANKQYGAAGILEFFLLQKKYLSKEAKSFGGIR